jgi:hypothetical protein
VTSAATKRRPLVWASVARILATTGIFVFHYLGLYDIIRVALSDASICVFCFLSASLARVPESGRPSWLARRFLGILIPYWMVIVPVLVANYLSAYKPVSAASVVVTLLGGSLFLSVKVYVIAWYITFVLLLYVYVYVESYLPYWARFPFMVATYLLMAYRFGTGYYFLVFLAGLRLHDLARALHKEGPTGRREGPSRLSNVLFAVQQHCYPFFLVHGAVLVFLIKMTSLPAWATFAIGFAGTGVLSVALHAVAAPVQAWACARAVAWIESRSDARKAGEAA